MPLNLYFMTQFHKTLEKVLLLTIIIISPTISWAEKSNKNQRPVALSERNYRIKFDLSMISGSTIPNKSTYGLDLDTFILNAQSIVNLKRNDFETSDEFFARQEKLLGNKFYSNITLTDLQAFSVKVPTKTLSNSFYYTYNADAQEINFYVTVSSKSLNSGIGAASYGAAPSNNVRSREFITFNKKFKSDRDYAATNAYGASVFIQKSNSEEVGIAFTNIERFKQSDRYISSNDYLLGTTKLDRHKAQNESDNLEVIAIIQPKSPFLVFDYYSSIPTLSNPIDHKTRARYVDGDLLGFVFHNSKTGEIYFRYPEGFGL